ncbi:MAG: hypothetical protein M1379_08815 [Firmicutes bacterium]|nr:hypothetical protein [Bacillota bacterium]
MIVNGNWKFDMARTQERYRALKEYYDTRGLNADNFSCPKYPDCLDSQKEGTIQQYLGGTAGLMPFYDVEYKNTPIRVLSVGKETGYMVNTPYGTSPNFDVNTLNVLNCINWKRKNNHIKGTLITLQRIFELETEYVYASYALSDALRCSFQLKNTADNVSAVKDTPKMRDNCLEYLVDEIRILEPTLIILQGEWAVAGRNPFVQRLAAQLGEQVRCVKKNQNGKYGLYEFTSFMCITSHHPAILGNWLVNLAPDSLWPMIDYLREIGYLPAFEPEDRLKYEKTVKPYVDPIITKLASNDRLRSKKAIDNQMSLFHFTDGRD